MKKTIKLILTTHVCYKGHCFWNDLLWYGFTLPTKKK